MPDDTQSLSTTRSSSLITNLSLNNPTLWVSGGMILVFLAIALYDMRLLTYIVNSGFSWSIKFFGWYWQILLLLTFLISLALMLLKTGKVRLGDLSQPEMNFFRWIAIILCTLLAGGGVFWAAAEPMAHFLNPPPLYGAQNDPDLSAINALAQTFVHWGFLAWAILGSLTTVVLMHLHHDKGLPLQPRTLLYPIFGKKVLTGFYGAIIDGFCIVSVVAGTVGPVGFLGLQVSYALNSLFALPDNFTVQATIVLIAIAAYTISALSGLSRGIQILSRINVILAVGLMLYILIVGPSGFIATHYLSAMGRMLDQFIPMALYRDNQQWLSLWTLFFWGWFLGYGPLMAIFIARISRGRTIRQLVLTLCFAAPLITCFWFTVVGGSAISFEIATPGSVSNAFSGFNLPASLLAVTAQLPLSTFISILFLILTAIFIITTGDSMTYTISVVICGHTQPHALMRIFWGVAMGVVALILIAIGKGSISSLQSFIVITAVPVSLILLPSLWNAPYFAYKMAKQQNVIK